MNVSNYSHTIYNFLCKIGENKDKLFAGQFYPLQSK